MDVETLTRGDGEILDGDNNRGRRRSNIASTAFAIFAKVLTLG